MSDTVEFRAFTQNDVDELYELLNTLSTEAKMFFHPHPFDKKTLQQISKSMTDHYFVLRIHKKIIGYSMLRLFEHPTPSIGICIRNGFENKGYGSMMTEMTLQKALELGYTEVILHVHEKNERAIHFYSKLGFRTKQRNSETCQIEMKKIL